MADGEAMDASFEAAMVGSCKLKRIAETPRASVVGEAEPATGSASEGGGKEAEYVRTERLEDHRLTAEGKAIRSGTGAAASEVGCALPSRVDSPFECLADNVDANAEPYAVCARVRKRSRRSCASWAHCTPRRTPWLMACNMNGLFPPNSFALQRNWNPDKTLLESADATQILFSFDQIWRLLSSV
ncbi:hypothetical protein JG687_00000647 [Phytophthora cactorum]|uniref:Uncharacterized protein n=1 Tax=Phytophthora cactorum TaxID=29920 RepID=A0A8T1UZF4_9STRA|nr:hypothetical protein JG687_00000647 [Phytophthora cactorum]